MKESTDIIVKLFASLFINVGENLSDALNSCSSAIDKYEGVLNACETEDETKKLESLRPFVTNLKTMTVWFSESIKTNEEEDRIAREIIDEMLKEE